MADLVLHHVHLVSRDVEHSARFYEGVIGLERIPRPPFGNQGIWLGAGPSLQLHLTTNPNGNYRTGPVDNDDVHFALRTLDFETMVQVLMAAGYTQMPRLIAQCG